MNEIYFPSTSEDESDDESDDDEGGLNKFGRESQ
jgi:hypothetical protein